MNSFMFQMLYIVEVLMQAITALSLALIAATYIFNSVKNANSSVPKTARTSKRSN